MAETSPPHRIFHAQQDRPKRPNGSVVRPVRTIPPNRHRRDYAEDDVCRDSNGTGHTHGRAGRPALLIKDDRLVLDGHIVSYTIHVAGPAIRRPDTEDAKGAHRARLVDS